MGRRANFRKYMKKHNLTRQEWWILKREIKHLQREIYLLQHKKSKLDVKVECYFPPHKPIS